MESVTTPVFSVGCDHRYTAFNSAHATAMKTVYGAEIGVGDSIFACMAHEAERARAKAILDRALGGEVFDMETSTGASSVDRRFLSVSHYPIRSWEGAVLGVAVFARDITDARRLEAEKRAFELRVRQQQRLESIGILASGIAHEINNPLNVIVNYSQIICDDPSSPPDVREYALEVVKMSDRVASIVQNLIRFSKLAGEPTGAASAGHLVESTLSMARTLLAQDHILLGVDVPDDLPQIRCRTESLRQVIMNLVMNARNTLNERFPDAHDDKRLHVRAELRGPVDAQRVRITVEDQGMGIPPDVVDQIFDPFYTTRPRNAATGLGLSICHQIVKEHGGEMDFETEPGRGSRFYFEISVDR